MTRFRRANITILITIFLLGCAFLLAVPAAASKDRPGDPDHLSPLYGTYDMYGKAPITVIVEIDTPSLIEAKHLKISQTEGYIDQQRRKVIERIKERIPKAIIQTTYDTLLAGMAVSLPVTELPRLVATEGIRAVYPDLIYTVDQQEGSSVFDPDKSKVNSPTLTGLDSVRNKWRYTGKDVTVAVVDSGVDYRHPDLAHAFGNYKGWDFIDDDDDPLETQANDPAGEATTHGTRMAGLIAARGAIQGIAPDATLLAYRVIGPGGAGRTEQVLAGLERAVKDGAEVICLALINQDTDWALGKAIHWAQAENVFVVASHQMSVAVDEEQLDTDQALPAFQVEAVPAEAQSYTARLVIDDGVYIENIRPDRRLPSTESPPQERYELVYVGHNTLAEIQRMELEGKVALMNDSQLPLRDYITALYRAGAESVIIYLKEAGEPSFTVSGLPLATYVLPQQEAASLAKVTRNIRKPASQELRLVKVSAESKPGPLSPFFSGETHHRPVPDLLTPGQSALSTMPLSAYGERVSYGYTVSRGGQNAVALMSGAAALLTQAEQDAPQSLTMMEKHELLTRTAYRSERLVLNVYDLSRELLLSQPAAGHINIYYAIYSMLEEGQEDREENGLQTDEQHQEQMISMESTPISEEENGATLQIKDHAAIENLNVISLDNHMYQIQLTLPEKAVMVQLWVFDRNNKYAGSIGTYLGVDRVIIPRWNGMIDHQPLPEGEYTLVAYVADHGKGRFVTSTPFLYSTQ
jgi:minor extracellular serine protease Vpr